MSETAQKMTVAEWLALQPTTEEVQNGTHSKFGDDDGESHKALILDLFAGVEKMKLASLITDAVGALYTAEDRYCIIVLKHLVETLTKDYVLNQMPPGLAAIIAMITADE